MIDSLSDCLASQLIYCLGITYKNNSKSEKPRERVLTVNAAGVESATCGFVRSWKSVCCKPLRDEFFFASYFYAIIYILRRHSLTTRWWTDHVWFMCYVYAIACHLLLHGIWLLWKEVGICMMPHRSWATKVIAWLAACCCVTYWVAPIIPWQLHAYSYISIMQPIVYVFVIATTIRIAVVAGNSSRAAALSHTIYPSHSYFSWNLWLISHVRVALLHGWYVIRFVAPLNYLLPQSII